MTQAPNGSAGVMATACAKEGVVCNTGSPLGRLANSGWWRRWRKTTKKSVRRAMAEVSKLTSRQTTWMAAEDVVERLNRLLVGWGNYFNLGPVSKAYRVIDAHTRHRLRWWLCRKHKMGGQGTSRFPDEFLISDLGLVSLSATTRNLPWAKA